MSDEDLLVIETALRDVIDDDLMAHVPGNLRSSVEASFRERRKETGAERFDLKLFGEKVGEFVFVEIPEIKSCVVDVPEVDDVEEVRCSGNKGFRDYVKQRTDEWLEEEMGNLALDWFDETGELVDGVSLHERVRTPLPARSYDPVVTVDRRKVLIALCGTEIGEV